MQVSEFIIQADGRRVPGIWRWLPEWFREFWFELSEATMQAGQAAPVAAASFIAATDCRKMVRRLKVTRISQWYPAGRTGLCVDHGDPRTETVVIYGREHIKFHIPVAEFDELVKQAGGKITAQAT